jgi:hypothetical protein
MFASSADPSKVLAVRRMEYTSGESVLNYTKKNTQGLPGGLEKSVEPRSQFAL